MSETLCYFKSGIGNLIVATPALQALASMDPTGKVDMLLASNWRDSRLPAIRDILSAAPFIDRIHEFPGCSLNGHKRFFIPVQCEASDAGHYMQSRTGYARAHWPGSDWPSTGEHEIDANMRYARKIGYSGPTPKLWVPVGDSPDLSSFPRPIIALCNGAFGHQMWEKKRWPYFPRLAMALNGSFGGSVVGVGGEKELSGTRLDADFGGKLPFSGTTKALSQADLLISTDTGCMHAADAIGTPTIGIFGATLLTKNRPIGGRSVAILPRAKCAPCQYTGRFHTCMHYVCMERTTPGDVMRIARKIIERGN